MGEDRTGDRVPGPAAGGLPARLRAVPAELAVLTLLAALTRFVGLNHPRAVVFDEIYFREYALRYLDGTFFFDLHPPLGKLLIAGWAKLAGVSVDPASADPAVLLRVLPALAGTLLIPVFYLFLRELRAGRKVATLGAALLLLDNAVLVESRFILVDSLLLLFGLGAFTCFLAARRSSGRSHWALLAAAAVLAGMAASTKWTGLTALGVVGVTWAAQSLRDRLPWRRMAAEGALLALLPALVYVLVFTIHFGLLTKSGPGDAYLSAEYQATLTGSQYYDPGAHLSVAHKLLETNRSIHSYEASLDSSTHPYQSTWLSWPVMHRPVYYWNGPASGGKQEYIYLQGNPLLWWGILVGALVVAVGWLRRPELFTRYRWALGFLALAWVANFLPFATIARPMFLYHYLFALMYSLAFVVLGIGVLAGWVPEEEEKAGPGRTATTVAARAPWRFRTRRSLVLYGGIVAVIVVSFAFFAPLSYGTPLTDAGLRHRIWISSWR